ncbi:MAG: class I SAM-dependent methyltransferase [Oscillospiraceae bacterium]|nr:class I SAM-dependent methyltransferase [Oscillospiraceae bacterium]
MRTVLENNIWFCENLEKYTQLEGKTILDIGCGNGDLVKHIANKYEPNYIVGIDPALDEWETKASIGNNWEIQFGDAHGLEFPDNYFDVIVSFSTFEHILNIENALNEVRRVLKPYGRFYTEFAPIWTSAAGHHFIHGNDRWWTVKHLLCIPPWAHLYMSEHEMRQLLKNNMRDTELTNEIIFFIYHSNVINRCSYSSLSYSIMNSGMIIRAYEERISFNRLGLISGERDSELSRDIVERINETEYKINDLGVAGLRVCLEKYASI